MRAVVLLLAWSISLVSPLSSSGRCSASASDQIATATLPSDAPAHHGAHSTGEEGESAPASSEQCPMHGLCAVSPVLLRAPIAIAGATPTAALDWPTIEDAAAVTDRTPEPPPPRA